MIRSDDTNHFSSTFGIHILSLNENIEKACSMPPKQYVKASGREVIVKRYCKTNPINNGMNL
jgi:hypothetical protein